MQRSVQQYEVPDITEYSYTSTWLQYFYTACWSSTYVRDMQ